ncbi:hypothetical protein EUTSA_v10019461mg [Eutrema salsugineum]|uniref:Uncharacterized protein n=1 Tax=Eutrema salsugineum TaxID=72664 RepID=V4KN85_EUTSA|nr:hypothetical protein EUTSA_v10019461mg [Eutrema salsugineum]
MENWETIPVDLIMEILSRLRPKSIARCVSKLWASTLASSYFTELFMTRSCARPQLLFSLRRSNALFVFSLPQILDPDENSCLVAANHLMIVLHCTRQSIPLPRVKTKSVGGVSSLLGFDPIDKQFKVLFMTTQYSGEGTCYQEHQVLTLGTGNLSWRMTVAEPEIMIECPIKQIYPGNSEICINGVLYYVAWVASQVSPGILCFNVRSEKFSVIYNPEDLVIRSDSTLVNYKARCLELWVLVDAEKHEWSRHIYALPSSWKNVVAQALIFVVGVISTNEFVLSPCYLVDPFYVFYYNIEKNTIRRVEIQGMDAFKHCSFHISIDLVEDVKLMQYV